MKILLIDNANNSLLELKQKLLKTRAKFAHVTGLNAAILALSEHKFNVVICAIQSESNGENALVEMIAKRFPAIVRITVSDTEQSQNNAHYCFNQPLACEEVISTIASLAKNNQAITKDIIVRTVENIKTLPSPPKVYLQLNAILKERNSDSDKIANIIQSDPALTAKVLQFSNKTFPSNGKQMLNISDAITKMGIDTLCCIVMTAELLSYQPDIKGFSILEEQLHCLATAKLAGSLVKPALKQDAMIAGLLHDIGKLVLFEINEKSTALFFKHHKIKANNVALENKIFAIDHCHVGGYLLHTWGFSYHIIEAVILHHRPEKLLKKDFGVAQAVYLANVMMAKQTPNTEFINHYKLTDSLSELNKRAEKLI